MISNALSQLIKEYQKLMARKLEHRNFLDDMTAKEDAHTAMMNAWLPSFLREFDAFEKILFSEFTISPAGQTAIENFMNIATELLVMLQESDTPLAQREEQIVKMKQAIALEDEAFSKVLERFMVGCIKTRIEFRSR
ncbi:hypothetical protein N7486_009606 [Penicillium sp. IBT 16267x]|nr:hypothetical protein N7486_009606 [Penicillium sp. IBT 16267x]